MTVEATQDISLKSDANVSIEAAQQLKLKGGSGAKLESSGIVDVDGAQITLN